jgi:hypothetical protein
MKITVCSACLLLILGGLGIQPTVAGPDDIVPLVYVVEQPDSPIEITSVDLQGTSISASDKESATVYTLESCVTYKVHNRSDRTVQIFDLELVVSPGGFPVGNFEGGRSLPSTQFVATGIWPERRDKGLSWFVDRDNATKFARFGQICESAKAARICGRR